MSPLFRIWALTASCVALLLALRGAWPLALACFLLSPAPALVFVRGAPEQRVASLSWLRAVVAGLAVLAMLFAALVWMGGIPPVHEWRPAAAR